MKRDRQLETTLIREARQRTQDARSARRAYRDELTDIRDAQRAETASMKAMLKEEWTTRRTALTTRHIHERDALKAEHGQIKARLMRVVDFTGRTRQRQDDERRSMQASHVEQRAELVTSYRSLKQDEQERLSSRYGTMKRELRADHAPQFARLKIAHRQADTEADRQRQMRAAERDQAERRLEEQIKIAERLYKSRQQDRSRDRGRGFDIG